MKNILCLIHFLSLLAISCVEEKKETVSDDKTNPTSNENVPVKKNDTIEKKIEKVKADSAKENNAQVKIDSPINYERNIEKEKPVIYAYCNKKTDISIELQVKGTLTFSYPLINNNVWKGTVIPNEGILVDGKTYPYLFWESLYSDIPTQVEESGFVVEGKNSIAFLEEKLNLMGLNQREITDFITYWGPRMQENKYNFVHFLGSEAYNEQIASINISPKPDNLFRLFMYFRPMNSKINVKEQALPKINSRAGLTIVEWGGSELKTLEQVN